MLRHYSIEMNAMKGRNVWLKMTIIIYEPNA